MRQSALERQTHPVVKLVSWRPSPFHGSNAKLKQVGSREMACISEIATSCGLPQPRFTQFAEEPELRSANLSKRNDSNRQVFDRPSLRACSLQTHQSGARRAARAPPARAEPARAARAFPRGREAEWRAAAWGLEKGWRASQRNFVRESVHSRSPLPFFGRVALLKQTTKKRYSCSNLSTAGPSIASRESTSCLQFLGRHDLPSAFRIFAVFYFPRLSTGKMFPRELRQMEGSHFVPEHSPLRCLRSVCSAQRFVEVE